MKETLRKRIEEWLAIDVTKSCWDRIELIKKVEPMYEGQPYGLRYANSYKYLLENIPIVYEKGLEFAGKLRKVHITEQQRDEARAMYKRWWDIPDKDFQKQTFFVYCMEENDYKWTGAQMPFLLTRGHLAFDWEELVNEGFPGFLALAEEGLKNFAEDEDKKQFFEASIITLNAFRGFFRRFGDIAEENGETEKGKMIRELADRAPKTLEEALQIVHLTIFAVDRIIGYSSECLGHADQYLYPFYKKDIEEGRLDEKSARELLQEFLFYDAEGGTPFDHMSLDAEATAMNIDVTGDDNVYMILGGRIGENQSGFNDLTMRFLEANYEMNMLRTPTMIVRCFEGMEEKYFLQAVSNMCNMAPTFIYNDDTMMPGFEYYGVKKEDTYNYGMFGCNNPTILANASPLRQFWFNLAIPLELVLNEGKAFYKKPVYDEECAIPLKDRLFGGMESGYNGVDTGKLEDIKSMDDFLSAYEKQLTYLVSEYRKGIEADGVIEREYGHDRFQVEDCLTRKTLEKGETTLLGGVDVHLIMLNGGGIATVTDSLYTINRLCFVEKRYTLRELADILKKNFEGEELLLRRIVNKYPKFGNDEGEVDIFAKKVTDIFTGAVAAQNKGNYLYNLAAELSTLRDFSTEGKVVMATPNGRKAGEPLSENQSPTAGADTKGLTALLNSLSNIPFNKIIGGPLNIRLHPSLLKGEGGVEKVAAALKTYFQKGGMQVQLNIIDAETLRAAQADPDKYRGLTVRVTGYNAYFVRMSKRGQEEFIARTEKGCI